MHNKHYPKLGGDLKYGCERLAKGLGAVGAVVVLYRGMKEETEIGMSFAPGFKISATVFRQLTDEILKDTYSVSIDSPNRACVMLAEQTCAECVILFLIEKDGAVRVAVNQSRPKDFVAAFALGIANSFVAMN